MDYNLNKEIYFKKEAREKLLNGINKLADAVSSTMGPNGKTVIITGEKGEPYATKDGVSVAKAVQFKDPVENIGAQMVKEAAIKSGDEAGDGTTTATVLAQTFINNLKDFEPNEITKAFDEIIPKVISELKNNSKPLNKSDIRFVASISANNDMEIGDNIQNAFNFSNIVKIEKSNNNKDEIILVNGTQINTTYFSKHFINNTSKAECLLEEPKVLIIDGKLENLLPFEFIFKNCAETDTPLLIITEHVSEKALRLIETNVISGNLKCCVIKSPGFGQHRRDLLRDLSDLTGATIINNFNNKYNNNVLGILKSIKVNQNNSVLVKHENINIEDLILSLKELIDSKTIHDNDLDLLKQRYEILSGKIAIIKVGGGSELEMKERYDRYDDAVKAVACALEEGIVEGAGVALQKCVFNLSEKSNEITIKILQSLLSPKQKIVENGSKVYIENMFDLNIIDPLKVTRCALENAVSVAKIILTTNCVVLNEYQWN